MQKLSRARDAERQKKKERTVCVVKKEALEVAALRDLGLADSMETFASSMF